MKQRRRNRILGIVAVLLPHAVGVQEPSRASEELPESATSCARIADDAERLACFDALAAGGPAQKPRTYIERHWDLYDDGGVFQPWAHRPTYALLGRWTDSTNGRPFAAVDRSSDGSLALQSVEAKFQISFKTKLHDGLFGGPGDLWFGYTQQSHFQIYNRTESRPFRETDFEPEAILTFPVRRTWGSWTWRMVGAGVTHQSNGRSQPLSRSWNRIYFLAGIERKDVVIHIRPWIRFDSTDPNDDDNPDIVNFIGRLETVVQWQANLQTFVFRGRSNLRPDGHRGSVQVDWFFPIRSAMRGHLQVFTGYGESLIDYDHKQNSIGLGLLLFDPF